MGFCLQLSGAQRVCIVSPLRAARRALMPRTAGLPQALKRTSDRRLYKSQKFARTPFLGKSQEAPAANGKDFPRGVRVHERVIKDTAAARQYRKRNPAERRVHSGRLSAPKRKSQDEKAPGPIAALVRASWRISSRRASR